MEGRKKDSVAWKCAVVKVRGSRKEPEEESEGERRQDIRCLEDEVIKTKSDIAKDI